MGVDIHWQQRLQHCPQFIRDTRTPSWCGCETFALGFFSAFLVSSLSLPKDWRKGFETRMKCSLVSPQTPLLSRPFRQSLGLFYHRRGVFGSTLLTTLASQRFRNKLLVLLSRMCRPRVRLPK